MLGGTGLGWEGRVGSQHGKATTEAGPACRLMAKFWAGRGGSSRRSNSAAGADIGLLAGRAEIVEQHGLRLGASEWTLYPKAGFPAIVLPGYRGTYYSFGRG